MSQTPPDAEMAEWSVLIAEDEALIRLDAAETLRDAGLRVMEASNGAEALELLESGLKIAVLVTDISMPGEPDGLALAKAARTIYPGLPVVIASAFAPADSVPFRTLRKPYASSQLLTVVTQLLEEQWHTVNALADGDRGSQVC